MNNNSDYELRRFSSEEFEKICSEPLPVINDELYMSILRSGDILEKEVQKGENEHEVIVKFKYMFCGMTAQIERVFKKGFEINDNKINISHRYIDAGEFQEILEVIESDNKYELHGNFSFFDCDIEIKPLELNFCSFKNAIFSGPVSLYTCTFKGCADFKESRFLGDVCFFGSIFSEDAEFIRVKFNKMVNFSWSEFSKDVDFSWCTANEDLDFSHSKFSGNAKFNNSELMGNVNFSRSEFSKDIYLHGSKFYKDVIIITTKFSGEFDSRNVVFFHDVDLSNCEFIGDVIISKINAEKISTSGNINNAYFNNAKFSKECRMWINCKNVNFNESLFAGHTELNIFQGDATFDKCIFENTIVFNEFNKLGLNNIKLTGILYLDWNKLNAKQRKRDLILNKERSECKLIAPNSTAFQALKENYRQIGQYDEEDEAYVEYKREKKKEKGGLFANLPSMIDLIGEYGTNPKLVACWMLIVPVIFGFIYTAIMEWGSGITIGTNMGNLLDGFYLSGITFLTIGFSDMYPTETIPRLLVVIEGFMGLFLMAYLTISFTRKTLR